MIEAQTSPPVEWAKNIVSTEDVIFLDTETTGVLPTSEVVDIGVVDINGNVLLDTLVRPMDPIPDEASNIHGISNDDVALAPWWPEVYVELSSIFRNFSVVVIYNLDFDVRLINQSNRRYSLNPMRFHEQKDYQWFCAMKQYSTFKGQQDRKRGGNKWHKLSVASQQFGIEIPDDLHRALADAELTRQLIWAMAGVQE